jgi:hypothetical protein
MDLTDRRRGGRVVVELQEQAAPLRPELPAEHVVHQRGRHWRGGVLQPGQRGAVRRHQRLGKRRLEDRQRLPELHGAALEFAEHPEELLRGPLLHLDRHGLGGCAADAPPEADRGPPRKPQRQGGQPGRPGHGVAGKIVHAPIVA